MSLPSQEQERKMKIAQRIAADMFMISEHSTSSAHVTIVESDSSITSIVTQKTPAQLLLIAERTKRTLHLIGFDTDNVIYNMEFEKRLIMERNIDILLQELRGMTELDFVRVHSLLDLVTDHLQVSINRSESPSILIF
jgi:transcriptional antiterminator